MKPQKYPLEAVAWLDHITSNSWRSKNDHAIQPTTIVSIGQPVHEDRRILVLAMSRDPGDHQFIGSVTIIKSCIVRRKKLRVFI